MYAKCVRNSASIQIKEIDNPERQSIILHLMTMTHHILRLLPLCLFALAHPVLAPAMDSTEILPKGINSPAFRYGIISGVDSKYSADGSVMSLNDINTVHFTSDQLVKLDPKITELVAILNQFSQQRLGSQIHLGTLRVETEPTVKYIAPIYARGISDRLTLAVAMPVVFYENKMSLAQSSSNVKAICSQFTGIEDDIPELKRGLQRAGREGGRCNPGGSWPRRDTSPLKTGKNP
jgi:hypothetical protein